MYIHMHMHMYIHMHMYMGVIMLYVCEDLHMHYSCAWFAPFLIVARVS